MCVFLLSIIFDTQAFMANSSSYMRSKNTSVCYSEIQAEQKFAILCCWFINMAKKQYEIL